MKINGQPVIDAKKAIVLQITPKDVTKGDNKDPAACAAAQACIRQLGAEAARVHVGRTYLKIGNKWTRFHTSKALRSEIVAFDRGGTFAPGEYVLAPMQPSKATGKQQGSSKTGKNKSRSQPKIARRKYHTVAGIRAHGANR